MSPHQRSWLRESPWVLAGVILSSILVTTTILSPKTTSTAAPVTQTVTYKWPNYYDVFVVPAGVTQLHVDMDAGSDGWQQALGGRVITDIQVTPGESLQVYVGGAGDPAQGTPGWPDGGAGSGVVGVSNSSGGGGSSSLRTLDGSIVVIAGGGGGSTNFNFGGAGGFPHGGDGHFGWVNRDDMNGKGATQSAGGVGGCYFDGTCSNISNGSFLQGGDAVYGGGGGGGYYGGGAGGGGLDGTDVYVTGGGGGSSWVDPARLVTGTSPYYQPGYFPDDYTQWLNGYGYVTLTWNVPAATTTTTSSPTTTSAPTTSTTTTIAPTPAAPSWTSTPDTESDLSITGFVPYPITGVGVVVVSDDSGFTVSKSNVLIPKWRTRVYIGDFKFSLKSTYVNSKKRRVTYSCTFPKFGTQQIIKSTNKWRWYQPKKGCKIPTDLARSLVARKATITLSGTFTRKWASTGKTTRPDGSKIGIRRLSLRIGNVNEVKLQRMSNTGELQK